MESLVNSDYLTYVLLLCLCLLNQKYFGYCKITEYLYAVIPAATPLLGLQSLLLLHSNQSWSCEAIIKTSDEKQ